MTKTHLKCSSVLFVSGWEECVTTAMRSGHRTAIFNKEYSNCSICDERGHQYVVREGDVKWGENNFGHNMNSGFS